MLEIEELCREHFHSSNIRVVRGGCRNFCSMGPNVYFEGQHFTKVKSIEDCQKVMGHISAEDAEHSIPALQSKQQVAPIATRMMTLRAERERWKFLRDLARSRQSRKCRKRSADLQKRLEDLCLLERSNADEGSEACQRVNRRKERYTAFLNGAFDGESVSSEDSNDRDR